MLWSTSCCPAIAGTPLPDASHGPSRDPSSPARVVTVAFARLAGWIERYDARHPDTVWTIEPSAVRAVSPDGARASWPVPFPPLARTDRSGLLAHLGEPRRIGVVLVRRGGFAVAHVVGAEIVEAKVGQRHVQGKTKAGGWSQQRVARRRDNQAREAYAAAAGHVARILGPVAEKLDEIVIGGDRAGVQAVLDDARAAPLAGIPQHWIGAVADPRRAVLEAAVQQARSVQVTVTDSTHCV